MSLGIFSFDLAAIINSLSNFVELAETAPVVNEATLEKIEDVLQDVKAEDSKLDDILMAAALANTVTAVMANENTKKEPLKPVAPAPKTTAPVRSVTLDEETRREIERLIKSLQTSVIHNYRDADIIDEAVSFNSVEDFPKREMPRESENREEKLSEDRKRENQKLEKLREDLNWARLKNNLEG